MCAPLAQFPCPTTALILLLPFSVLVEEGSALKLSLVSFSPLLKRPPCPALFTYLWGLAQEPRPSLIFPTVSTVLKSLSSLILWSIVFTSSQLESTQDSVLRPLLCMPMVASQSIALNSKHTWWSMVEAGPSICLQATHQDTFPSRSSGHVFVAHNEQLECFTSPHKPYTRRSSTLSQCFSNTGRSWPHPAGSSTSSSPRVWPITTLPVMAASPQSKIP